jgi:hypothetical protein
MHLLLQVLKILGLAVLIILLMESAGKPKWRMFTRFGK